MSYADIVLKIENGKWYKNWKVFCESVDIKYASFNSSKDKKRLIDYIDNYYSIEKNGYSIKFIKNNISLDNVHDDKAMDELFHFKHEGLSRFFQAGLINYMGNFIKNNNTPSFVMSINYMLKNLDMISRSPGELRNNEKYIGYDKEYVNAYYVANRQSRYNVFQGGLDNLQNKGVMEYDIGHNISFILCNRKKHIKEKYLEDKELLRKHKLMIKFNNMAEDDLYYYTNKVIDNFNDVFASNEIKTSLFNGMVDAWLIMCDIFGFKDNKHDDLNMRIYYGQLFDTKWVKWFKSKNRSIMNSYKYKLPYEEYNELVRFFNSEMNYYDLFYKISKITTGRRIKKYLYPMSSDNEIIYVDYYYKAYQIHINEPAIDRYKDILIDRVLGDTPYEKGKKLNMEYLATKMYKELDKNKEIREKAKNKINLPKNSYSTNLSKYIVESSIIEQILGICSYMIDKNNEECAIDKYRDLIFNDVIEEYKSKI